MPWVAHLVVFLQADAIFELKRGALYLFVRFFQPDPRCNHHIIGRLGVLSLNDAFDIAGDLFY